MFKRQMMIVFTVLCMVLLGAQSVFAAEKNNLPNIKILATGGTIAGSASSNTQMTGYKAGAIGIQTLIDAVPQMKEYANVSGEQVCKLDSKDMSNDVWLTLSKRVNEVLADRDVDGIVITHGTDTLEETAYFLNLVVKSDKPVVLVGAMRPATAISADGPLNLLNAVRVASSKEAVGKGVLVTMNDEINGAREVTKTNTNNVATFKAPELGFLGYVNDGKPYFYRESTRKHTAKSEFDVTKLNALPYVKVIYGHADDDGIFVDAAVAAGAKGIIYAGTGNGSIHKNAETALAKAAQKGVVIVRSSRVGNGTVIDAEQSYIDAHFLNGDSLNPQKARILLSLALTKTNDLKEIQRIFNEY
uniref:type II asparaginase n=1 Tax=Massilibacillus massiliensis TaxID=1806837 RepID=UPI000ACCD915|nr:type II asparaginase [Massilibacillus massiliensis]